MKIEEFKANAERVLQLLKEGVDATGVARASLSTSQRQTLLIASLFRSFSESEFGIAASLAPEQKGVSLEALAGTDWLVESSRTRGMYRLASKERSEFLDDWKVFLELPSGQLAGRDADRFARIHTELARYYAEHRPQSLEHLHHLLVASPMDGIQLMHQMLRRCLPQPADDGRGAIDASDSDARQGIALAQAKDILDTVDGQKQFLSPKVVDEYFESRRLVHAWSTWCDQWYRSRRYVQRDDAHRWFEELHQVDAAHRILEIHAPGGSGKTMALRWLITHHCVPRGKLIAHLDFDRFMGQPQRPWQLLLQCAMQMNQQLPQAPFDSLLTEGQDLQRALTAEAGIPSSSFEVFEREFPTRFASVLNSSTNQIVTIIIDTFEEATVRELTKAPVFIAALSRLAMTCPNVRLIVCGRYPLSHRNLAETLEAEFAPEFEFYQSQVSRQALRHFNKSEVSRYLDKRSVRLDPPTVDRLYEAASAIEVSEQESQNPGIQGASPFYLALIVDLIQDPKRRVSVDRVLDDIQDVQVIYLIERVLNRIDDVGSRWLLRYGVIPRQLSRSFFENVIVPYLRQVNGGKNPEDDPSQESVLSGLMESSVYFKESEILSEGSDTIWEHLCAYAHSDAWVEKISPTQLSFHPCVREPMRALLSQQPVLKNIHLKAADYFEGLGDAESLRESVYHRLQSGLESQITRCRDLCQRLADQSQPNLAYAVADELVNWHVEHDGEWERVFALTAYYIRFTAAIDMIDLGDHMNPGIQEIRTDRANWLQRAEQASSQLNVIDSGSRNDRIMAAMILIRQRNQSLKIVDRALMLLREGGSSSEHLDSNNLIQRSIAIAKDRLQDPECVWVFGDLLDREKNVDGPRVRFAFASFSSVIAKYGSHTNWLRKVNDRWNALPNKFWESAFAELLFSLGRHESAGNLLKTHFAHDLELSLRAETADARERPRVAATACATLRNELPRDNAHSRLVGLTLRQQAYATTVMADFRTSDSIIRDAIGTFRSAGDTFLAAQTELMAAEISLHHCGDYRTARRVLDSLERSSHIRDSSDTSQRLRLNLLDFEIKLASDTPFDTRFYAKDLLAQGVAASWCIDQSRCALTLLAHADEQELKKMSRQALYLLIDTFKQRPDGVARSCYPWLFRNRVKPIKVPSSCAKQICELVLELPSEPCFGLDATDSDQAWADLANAHLLRCLGRKEAALRLSQRAKTYFDEVPSLPGLREVWHLDAMLGGSAFSVARLNSFAKEDLTHLTSVIALEQAEHCLRRDDRSGVHEMLGLIDLNQLESQPGDFQARLNAVHGRNFHREEATKQAREAFEQSSRLYRSMGNDRMADLMRDEGKHSNITSSDRGVANVDLFNNDRGTVTSQTSLSSPDLSWPTASFHELRLDRSALGDKFNMLLRGNEWIDESDHGYVRKIWTDDIETAPQTIAGALANRSPRFVASVMKRLVEAQFLDPEVRAASDLVLAGDLMAVVSLPWELGRFDRETWERWKLRMIYRSVNRRDPYRIRWLQIALMGAGYDIAVDDGIWTDETESAFESFCHREQPVDIEQVRRQLSRSSSNSGERPHAAILESTAKRQADSSRGLAYRGVELADAYERCGFECETFYGTSLEDLSSKWSPEQPPAIVHVYAPYRASRSSGRVMPDFGDDEKRSDMKNPGRRDFLPGLLILDGPPEPDSHEQIRQLMLRNAAGTMLARGDFANIVAFGLDRQPNIQRLTQLLNSVSDGESMRQIYEPLFAGSSIDTYESLNEQILCDETGLVAPAMWCADPDLSAIPMGRADR